MLRYPKHQLLFSPEGWSTRLRRSSLWTFLWEQQNHPGFPFKKILCQDHFLQWAFNPCHYIKFSDGSCILPSGSVKTAKEFSSDSHYKGRLSYTSFAHCSTELNQIAYRPVPCFPRYDSNFVYAIYEGYLLMPDLEPSCSLISVAPEDFVDVKFPSYEATGHENFAGRIPPWMVGREQNTRWLRVLCYRFFPVFNKFCLEF